MNGSRGAVEAMSKYFDMLAYLMGKQAGGGGGGAGWTNDGIATATEPNGNIVLGPNVTEIKANAFAGKPITRISGANVTKIGAFAFADCQELTQITKDDFPNVTQISGDAAYAFIRGCSKLQLIHFPKLTTIPTGQWPSGTGAIGSSTIKPILVLPKVTKFPNFRSYTTRFAAIDLGPDITTTEISGTEYFYEGYVDILIIRKSDAIVAAGNSNAIRRISSTTKIFVPQALVSSYETASNWSAKGSIFYAIEGSQYEHYYADGTPIPTT